VCFVELNEPRSAVRLGFWKGSGSSVTWVCLSCHDSGQNCVHMRGVCVPTGCLYTGLFIIP
jgi:hypothetical protein